MKTVGVRELKNHLSEYLREVRNGESLLITDRGEVVAEVASPEYRQTDSSVPAGLRALAKKGQATLASPGQKMIYKRLPRPASAKRRAAEWLDAERGDR